jgi:steroid delta-isomerase-like uncharacterized protein
MSQDVQNILDSVVALWNTGNADIAKRIYTDDCPRIDPNVPADTRGGAAIARYVAEVRSAYPDFRLEVIDSVAQDDRLAVHWVATGTHKGNFLGIAPTGKKIKVAGMTLARVQNGKLAEDRTFFDRILLFEQLGVLPDALQTLTKGATG